MKNRKKMTSGYLKYVVKSPIVFYIYVIIFLLLFLLMTNAISVDRRTSYSAIVDKGQVQIVNETELELLDKRIYVYTDKNQEVLTLVVSSIEFGDGIISFILEQDQDILSGIVTVEAVTERSTLFHKIFSEVSRTR